MRLGEVRQLRIPAKEGYGERGFPAWGIPPGGTLLFESAHERRMRIGPRHAPSPWLSVEAGQRGQFSCTPQGQPEPPPCANHSVCALSRSRFAVELLEVTGGAKSEL